MGFTDGFLFPHFKLALKPYMEALPEGSSIAWLGQQAPRAGVNTSLHDALLGFTYGEMDNHYYDIENLGENSRSRWWDANTDWKEVVKGYDLVLGIRILYACNSASQVVRNLKYTVENNKKVVFDFMSGNNDRYKDFRRLHGEGHEQEEETRRRWMTQMHDDIEIFSKRSDTIIPFFPELYRESMILNMVGTDKFDAYSNHEDQIIAMKHLRAAGIRVSNLLGVRDPIKNRIYNLTELRKEGE